MDIPKSWNYFDEIKILCLRCAINAYSLSTNIVPWFKRACIVGFSRQILYLLRITAIQNLYWDGLMLLQTKQNNSIIAAMLAAIPEPFFIFDEGGRYIEILGGIDRNKYHDGQHLIGKRIHDVMDKVLADKFVAQIKKALQSGQVLNYVYQLSSKDIKGSEALPGPEGQQWFEAHISPIKDIEGQPRMVVWVAFSITKLQKTVNEKDALILELRNAIGEIKNLRGILPICSHCKKIRDDKGYWNQIEAYIQKHSEADLSHSICPDCARKHYPEYDIYDELNG